jgi:hypothetical protein
VVCRGGAVVFQRELVHSIVKQCPVVTTDHEASVFRGRSPVSQIAMQEGDGQRPVTDRRHSSLTVAAVLQLVSPPPPAGVSVRN